MNATVEELCVGMAKDEAVRFAEDKGLNPCVVREDDKVFAITMDLQTDRIQLEVDNGLVTHVRVG